MNYNIAAAGGLPAGAQPGEHGERAAYTVVEAALLLGLCQTTTYKYVREGKIPALRVGGRWIIPKRRFHAWLDELSTAGGEL